MNDYLISLSSRGADARTGRCHWCLQESGWWKMTHMRPVVRNGFLRIVVAGLLLCTGQSAYADEQNVDLALSDESVLCQVLLKQIQEAAEKNLQLCDLPKADSSAGLDKVLWVPVEFEEAKSSIVPILPLASTSAHILIIKAMQAIPPPLFADVKEGIWKQYGQQMLAPLMSKKAQIFKAELDVDNDGASEVVYRVPMPGYNNPAAAGLPSEPWSLAMCGDQSSQLAPYNFLAFENPAKARMGKLDGSEGDLFVYRGKVWASDATGSSVTIYKIKRRESAFRHQVCSLRR